MSTNAESEKTSVDSFIESVGITSPQVIYIMKTIKAIQKRMKDPDLVNVEYIRVYDKLSYEFEYFIEKYTDIFTRVVRGEKLGTTSSVLFHKNKMDIGETNQEKLRDALMEKYWPEDLKKEAKEKMKEMADQENPQINK